MEKLKDLENMDSAPIFFRIPSDFLKAFDEIIILDGYARRSEAIRTGMRMLLDDIRKRQKRLSKLRS